MDQGSQVVIIHLPPYGDENKMKQNLTSALGPDVSPEQIIIKERNHWITAYVELPEQAANSLIAKKSITVDGKNLVVKPFYCDHQIFINKLQSNINQDDVKEYFSKFGKVLSIKIVNVHHNYEARHCYIKFDTNFDPNDVIYHEKRHTIKNEEIRVHRTYGIAEGEQTDKRLFLKIEPKVDKGEEMEKALHNLFRKYGELRERIRIEDTSANSSKATITFIAHEDAEKAFENEKGTTIGKYKIILRPISSDLAIFAYGLRPDLSDQEIKKAFELYGKVIECKVTTKQSTGIKSATVNYANEENAREVLAEYMEYKEICALFYNKPKLTIHMNIKERNEFNDYNKKNKRNWQNVQMPPPNFVPPPMFPNQNMYFGQPGNIPIHQGGQQKGQMGMQPPMNPQMNQSIGMGQPPIGMGQPSFGMGQPPIGMGQPMGMGQPPIGMGSNRQPPISKPL